MMKDSLRKEYLDRRKSLDATQLVALNTDLIKHLTQVLDHYNLCHIGIFYPIHNEVDLRNLAFDYTVYYPKIIDENIVFFENNGTFIKASFNTMVPNNNQAVEPSTLDAVIVPGIVYDEKGYRLGYGKGYYDRFLRHYEGLRIGVCFSEYIVKALPVKAYDQAVDVIITEKKIVWSGMNV